MRFMYGIMVGFAVMFLANGIFLYLAMHSTDSLDPTYASEVR